MNVINLCYFVRPRAVLRKSALSRDHPYDGRNAASDIHNFRLTVTGQNMKCSFLSSGVVVLKSPIGHRY